EFAGVDPNSLFDIRLGQVVQRANGLLQPVVGRKDDGPDRQAELLGKLEVALVVGRYRHDSPSAVGGQHVVGDPDWDRCAVYRVDGGSSSENAGLVLGQLGAFQVALAGRLGLVSVHGGPLFGRGDLIDQRMLRCQDHVGGAE